MRAQPIDILPIRRTPGVIKRWLPDKGYMIDLLRQGLGGPGSAGGRAAMAPPEEVCRKRPEKDDALSWLKFADTLISRGVANRDAYILADRACHE